jgi:hypothetical protein
VYIAIEIKSVMAATSFDYYEIAATVKHVTCIVDKTKGIRHLSSSRSGVRSLCNPHVKRPTGMLLSGQEAELSGPLEQPS